MAKFTYTISEDQCTIEYLLREKWQAGKKTVHAMRMAKSVTNEEGEPLQWNDHLPKGMVVYFTIPEATSSYIEDSIDINIMYEDEHIIAVWKPAGIATHPSSPNETGTLMNRVFHYIKQHGGDYAEHIHRLDQGTEGVLLIAKHPIAKALFDRLIEHNEITRKYEAQVDGRLRRPRGTINRPIGKDRHHATRRRVSPNGQQAITHFKVIHRLENGTVVEATLETGRTHQIRVHFAHLGHPVTGDILYDGSETDDGHFRLKATELSFTHPFTLENLTIQSS